MIRHTIMWKFTDEFEKMDKQQIMERVKNGLTSLVGVVPGLKNASVEPRNLSRWKLWKHISQIRIISELPGL